MKRHFSRMRLYSNDGNRLYLNRSERLLFHQTANTQTQTLRLLCLVLFYSGCRLSEALNLRRQDIQQHESLLSIRTLKKRNQGSVREVPIPNFLAQELLSGTKDNHSSEKLWYIHRSTAWRQIRQVMHTAGIQGAHASPKGLRHSFGMYCAFKAIPITLCCKWMGHSNVTVTAIYYQLVGRDEIEMAERLWE